MLKIKEEYLKLVNESENELKEEFNKIDKLCFENSIKVLNSFHKYNVSETDFNESTGYGYNCVGRDKIEKIYADLFKCEDALVRTQIISGTHAITIGLFALLRPNDEMLSITGLPYDTLHEVIGITKNNSSLKSYNIKYNQIDLIDNDFDYEKIKVSLNNIKMVYIQRSRGYSLRDSISIDKLEKVIKLIKSINKNIIIFIDNCYTEFTEDKFPTEVNADILAGSLIKNLGAGICTNGGYLVGKKELINLCAERLNVPGEAKEVGPTKDNKMFLMGLYHSPSVIASSLKSSILISKVMEKLGYKVSPKYNDLRSDIVQMIYFNNNEQLIKFTIGIQSAGAINAHVIPIASDMPGYKDKIIMACPSFTEGSSIEISCDAPLKEPYVLYVQGGLTYEYAKIALINAISYIYS